MSEDAINQLAAQYKGSDEERDDLLAAYEEFEGDMNGVYETVMLSSVLDDDERFRGTLTPSGGKNGGSGSCESRA